MIDKLLLNNQLVSNKKKVQQVRVLCINKLVQKIRKLTELVEKHPADEKLKDKVRRTTETLVCIKKINHVEIIKKALVNENNPNTVITNGRSSPEEIAEALIISHKITNDLVASLKILFHLDSSNPGWKDEILEISKRKQKFLRTEMKKEKRADRKEKNALMRKRLEWLEENKIGGKEPVEESNEAATDWNVETLESTELEIIKENPKPTESEIIKTTPKPTESIKNKPKPKKVKVDHNNDSNPLQKIIKKELPNNKTIFEEPDEDEQKEAVVKTAVDSFFLTSTGHNYLSTAVIDRVQAEPLNDGLVRKERRANMQNPRKYGRNQKNFERGAGKFQKPNIQSFKDSKFQKPNTNLKNSKFEKPNITNFKDNRGKKDYVKPTTPAVSDDKVHPSWAAKQKQKGITEFAGKKITFGDDAAAPDTFKKAAVKPKPVERKISKPEEQAVKLHPSWEAKQKLKPSITKFEGKKIVFED